MPSLLATSATWLGGQLKTHGGEACTYFRGADALSITLVPVLSVQPRNWQFNARTKDFAAVVADLAIDEDPFLPSPLDEIEWTDDNGEPQIAVVFPRPEESGRAEHCYRLTDPTEKLIRIYTVAQDSLENVRITTGGSQPSKQFSTVAVPTAIRGAEVYDGETTRLLTAAAYILRSAFTVQGIETPPIMAKVDMYGLDGWAVSMAETQWGDVLVKLALQRETLVREWQARRNAAI